MPNQEAAYFAADIALEDVPFQDFNNAWGSSNDHNWEADGDTRWDSHGDGLPGGEQ